MKTQESWKVWRFGDSSKLEFLAGTYHTHQFARHWHDTYVIQIVLQGWNAFECAGRTYTAGPGSVVLINPGEVHTGASVGEVPLTYRAIYPTSSFLVDEMLGEWTDGRSFFSGFAPRVVSNPLLFRLLAAAHIASESHEDPLQTRSLMVQALCMVAFKNNFRAHTESHSRPAIQKAKEFLRENYNKNISLSELSRVSGLSAYHLLRSFQKETGVPPHQFLRNIRVQRARELLAFGLPITAVAQNTGFCDQSHLNRHFKKLVGITPGQYRATTSKTHRSLLF